MRYNDFITYFGSGCSWMHSKDISGNEKINRYNEIDLVGNYGIKDGFYVGGDSNKIDKDAVVSLLMWLGIIISAVLPVINLISLSVLACADINLNVRNFAKAALIFIVVAVFLFLLYL